MEDNRRIIIALLDQLSEKYESLGRISESSSLDRVSFLLTCLDIDPKSMRQVSILSKDFGLGLLDALNVQRTIGQIVNGSDD